MSSGGKFSHPLRDAHYRKLNNVTEADLKYVEKDLALYEKVSLSFLLFGKSKVDATYILQRLLILTNNPNDPSDLLCAYTKIEADWKNSLLEALCIIKANKVLRKLGFDIKELRVVFLPHVPETSLHIHPILKALYIMCENLNAVEAGRLTLEIKGRENYAGNHIRFYDPTFLEIFLLDWITRDIITIGKWPDPMNQSKPNLDLIIEFLKITEKYTVKDMLLSVMNEFNKKLLDQGDREKYPHLNRTNFNENDSSGGTSSTKNEGFEKKGSLDLVQDECYVIRRESAGFILIINQKEFYPEQNPALKDQLPSKPLKPRRGTDKDKEKLKSTFATFGYISVEIDGCTHLEMLNVIRDFVQRSIIYDSLIVCILSHGIEGAVYGKNSIPVRIQNIQKILASESLMGKPKMLIIQACQGEEFQTVRRVKQIKFQTVRRTEYLETDGSEPTAPAFSDMLTAIATVPGFASVRHIERGTWFIQTLCKSIDELGDRKHMLDILTAVNRQVTSMRGSGNQCMVPSSSQTLNKSFFLPRRF